MAVAAVVCLVEPVYSASKPTKGESLSYSVASGVYSRLAGDRRHLKCKCIDKS